MGSIVCKQQQLLKVMFFAFEAPLYGCQLVVVTHPLLFETFDNLLIGLFNGLCLVVLDHHLVESVLEHTNILHEGTLLNVASLAIFDLSQHIL